MSDLVISVRQISNYPATTAASSGDNLLMQAGGPGAPYISINAADLVASALQGGPAMGLGMAPPANADGGLFTGTITVPTDGAIAWNAYLNNGDWRLLTPGQAASIGWDQTSGLDFAVSTGGSAGQELTWAPMLRLDNAGNLGLPYGTIGVARDPSANNEVATAGWVGRNTVSTFNNRNGAVQLNAQDVYNALKLCDPIATQPWVQQAITSSIQNLLYTCPFVNTWNGRKGSVYLMLSDITTVFYQSGQQPISPTPVATSNDDSIATTKWVTDTIGPGIGAVNVKDFGATGDGATNDTAAFNAALAAASAANSQTVVIPSGFYNIDPITVPIGVVLQGTVPGPIDPQPGFLTHAFGATLFVNSHAAPFITLAGRSSGLQDVMIYDPGQVAPTATAPNVFPVQILMQDATKVRRVTLINAYEGIRVASGRCILEDCYIGAYNICVDVDTAQDVTYFRNVWCGAFYDTALNLFPLQNMDLWVLNNNGIGFQFRRADAVSMVNCGTFVKWASVYLTDGANGNSYGFSVNHMADVCIYGVVAISTSGMGWQFANLQTLPSQSAPTSAAPFYLPTGGVQAPRFTWSGGAVGFPADWAYPTGLVQNGQVVIQGVNGIGDAVPGVVNASNAVAGQLGEFISAANDTGTTLTSGQPANVTSIALTAGDWDVRGEVWILPAGATVLNAESAITTNSATLPAAPAPNASRTMMSGDMTAAVSMAMGPIRESLAAPATVYLIGQALFSGGGCTVQGVIAARRVR